MKIKLLCVGKTNENYLKEGISIYVQKIKHFVHFEIIELPDNKIKGNLNTVFIKEKEGEAIIKHIKSDDIIVLLDEKGEEFDSKKFATFLDKCILKSTKNLVFIVGGAYGFSKEIYGIAQHRISLSKMTFTHQMIRLIFAEQLYRGLSILKNLPYHNE